MRIKSIELVGFKSFADKQQLEIDRPVVAIVGPNGCGKSNIVDSIKWAMGEQSSKSLRGKRMEDVIFSGSEKRPPSPMAEVTLVFDNQDKSAPSDFARYDEISVTRKLFRSGDSDYLVNKSKARLKDITDIFLGTGVGKGAYSIIEQGMIGEIVAARPEERRQIIEEAAGITRYRLRRREAELKLDRTGQNLLRVSDRVEELGRRRRSLERQAQRARRYQQLREQLRSVELALAAHRLTAMRAAEAAATLALRTGQERRLAQQTRLAGLEGQRIKTEQQAAEKDELLRTLQSQFHRLESEGKLTEKQIEYNLTEANRLQNRGNTLEEDRNSLAARLAELENETEALGELREQMEDEHRNTLMGLNTQENRGREIDAQVNAIERKITEAKNTLFKLASDGVEAENRIRYLDTLREDLHLRHERQQREADELQGQYNGFMTELQRIEEELAILRAGMTSEQRDVSETEKELAATRETQQRTERDLHEIRAMHSRAASTLASLQELATRLEGAPDGVRDVAEHDDFPRKDAAGLLASLIEAPKELERALASVLGDRMGWLLVNKSKSALAAVDILSHRESGRGTFLSTELAEHSGAANPSDSLPPGITPLAAAVKSKAGVQQAVSLLLQGVYVAPDIASSMAFWKSRIAAGERCTLVTPTGEVLWPEGAMSAGIVSGVGEALLARTRRIHELEGEVATLGTKEAELKQQADELNQTVEAVRVRLADLRKAEQEGRIRVIEKEKEVSIARNESSRVEERLKVVVKEQQRLAHDMEENETEKKHVVQRRQEFRDRERRLQDDLNVFQDQYLTLTDQREDSRQKVTEAKTELARTREKLDGFQSQWARVDRERRETAERLKRLESEHKDGLSRSRNLTEEADKLKTALQLLESRRLQTEETLARSKDELEGLRSHLERLHAEAAEVRNLLEETTSGIHETELKLERTRGELEHLIEDINGRWELDIQSEAEAIIAASELPEDAADQVADCKRKIENLGPVNLLALGEFDEVAREHDFLEAQQKDLMEAVDNLRKTIDHINKTTRELFRKSFEEINESFQKVFPRLFMGGKAHLEMTEPNNLLETGVDIIARPPGKKPQSITLLSGGEKALTAVSLIFGIFLIKPTPFCILDEVDAPLDDANVGRVAEFVKELSSSSQFIIITHNKKTMQAADILYGVTTQEPGVSKLVSVDLKRKKEN